MHRLCMTRNKIGGIIQILVVDTYMQYNDINLYLTLIITMSFYY